jgi:hypothetical protein
MIATPPAGPPNPPLKQAAVDITSHSPVGTYTIYRINTPLKKD